MSMMKRFYEAKTIVIEFYSNAHVRRVEFKRHDDLYMETYETIDGRWNVLERAQMREPITIEEVEKSCNRICEFYEVISIHIE
jgi:hypothetical protein